MQNDDYNNVEAIVSTSKNESSKRSIAERKILDFKENDRYQHLEFFCKLCNKDIFIHADSLNLVVCNCIKCKESYYHASCIGRYMLNMPKLEVENLTSYNLYERVCPFCPRDQSMSLLIDFAREEDDEF